MTTVSELARPAPPPQCQFDEGWYRGRCRRSAHDGPFCREHAKERCKACGGQATYWCGHAGSFACGTPRCDTCDCPARGLDGAPGSHGWKWGKREQNAQSADEHEAEWQAGHAALLASEAAKRASGEYKPWRVLVCGGRNYADRHILFYFLDDLRKEFGEIEIGVGYDPRDKRYQGADQVAYEWATGRGVKGRCYPAHWDKEGPSAGPKRNQRMLKRFMPSLVVACPGGRGTADMVSRAEAAGVPVRRCER